MNKKELQDRTKQFHIDIIKFCSDFPKTAAGFEIAKQIIRSSGSVAANYWATNRAKSKADFVYKFKLYWKRRMKAIIGWRPLSNHK